MLAIRLTITFLGVALSSGIAHAQSEPAARSYVEYDGLAASIAQTYPEHSQTWENAKKQCAQLNFMGSGGWRLPSRAEVQKISPYNFPRLLPDDALHWREDVKAVWIDEYGPTTYGGEGGFTYVRDDSNPNHKVFFSSDTSIYRHLTMCVRAGPPTPLASHAPEKPVVPKTKTGTTSAPMLNLTRMPDRTEDKAAIVADRREQEKARVAAEQQAAREAAEQLARKLAADLKARQNCLLPENRNMCGCLKFQAKPPGGWKTCSK